MRRKKVVRNEKGLCAALELLSVPKVAPSLHAKSVPTLAPKIIQVDRSRRIRWNMGPCQHKTWLAALEQLDQEAEFCSLRQWRGFQIGAHRFIIRMNVDFCHDKHELAKALQLYPSAAAILPETHLSIEDFVHSGQNQGTSRWFLKISDVDYGCGVRSFQSPVSFAEVQQLLETCHLEATQSLSQLRKAKGCKPRDLGRKIVIQKAVETASQLNFDAGRKGPHYKEDLRVYVCCSVSLPHKVFVYRRLGVRRAPKPLDGSLDREVQCTHYGHITPAESIQEWPLYEMVFPQICQAVKCIMEIITPELEDRCSVLFGMDFICDAEQRPYLLEINQVPRLCYEDPRVQAWTQGMALDFLRLVLLADGNETALGHWLQVT